MKGTMKNLIKCTKEKWQKAQNNELLSWVNSGRTDGDDWNVWWKTKFNNYEFLKDKNINSILEVGCGPYANNTKLILQLLQKNDHRLGLLDPLLDEYIQNKLSVINLINEDTKTYNTALEEFCPDESYDLIICINVFDHVYDTERCLNNMYNSLNKEGIVIIGQDLTNETDLENVEVANDETHPIKLNHEFFRNELKRYSTHIFNKILSRNEGRNPSAHYGTLLYVGQK